MNEILEFFRSINFDGCLYAQLRTTKPVELITYSLYRNGDLVAQRSVTSANTQVTFPGQLAGSFQLTANITESGHSRMLSRELKVQNGLQLLKSHRTLATKSKTKDTSCACDNISRYFLEIQFAPGGLAQFHNECETHTPLFSQFKTDHLVECARSNQMAVAAVFPEATGRLSRLYQLIACGAGNKQCGYT